MSGRSGLVEFAMPPKNSSAFNSREWHRLNLPEQSVDFQVTGFCAEASVIDVSPIDDFYGYSLEIIKLGAPEALGNVPVVGRLLLLGLVSGVELYFRSILSGTVAICPIARRHARHLPVSLSAVDHYGSKRIELGLLENISLAGREEIIKQTKRLTGIDIKPGSSVYKAISDFGALCHFRHAAVHSRGELSAQNLHEIGVDLSGTHAALQVSFRDFQTVAQLCYNCVQSYNTTIFQAVVERWVGHSELCGDWSKDKQKFSPLFNLFKSKRDKTGPRNAYDAYRLLRRIIANTLTKLKIHEDTL